MKSSILWDTTPRRPLKVTAVSKKNVAGPAFTLVSCLGNFFDPDDGSDMFLRNVG
jgi:hypothetical protein